MSVADHPHADDVIAPEGGAPAPPSPDSPAAAFGSGERIRPADPIFLEVLCFLWDEAATLDRDELLAWIDMLDPSLEYTMPVRVTRRRNEGSEFDTGMMHFDETYHSIRFRIRRLLETTAWSEDPPSRARRSVTSVRAHRTAASDEFDVSSSLVVMRTQDDDYRVDIVTAERRDRVRRSADGSYVLLRREILLDQSTVGTPNLAIFF